MSITDELREAINELRVECEEKEGRGVLWYPEPSRDRFSAIANHIDQEHDKLMAECQDDLLIMDVKLENLASTLDCLCHELGVEIGNKKDSQIHSELVEAARNTIPLPKDADGVPIRIGDRLDGYNKTIEVVELRYGRSGWVLVSRDGNAYVDTFAFTHVRPDSWERIIRDAQGDGILNQIDGRPSDFDALVERCKRLCEQERANEV